MECYFYDTCSLLNLQDRAFKAPFAISDITLRELEDIKVSSHKDEDIKHAARVVTRLLAENRDVWAAYSCGHPRLSNDLTIVTIASELILTRHWNTYDPQPTVFVTDDLCLHNIAEAKRIPVATSEMVCSCSDESCVGVRVIEADDEIMEHFHDDLTANTAECVVNEYVFLNGAGKTNFGYRWTGSEYALVYSKTIESPEFGKLKPKDIYQRAAIDSIMNNMITGISGPAGSGKSLLSLACAFDLIRRGKYDRVVMLVNPARAKGAVATGFYPGTSEEKLLASFAGNMLRSKFGDSYAVEKLMDADKLRLICMGDIRGMEISEDEILYIPECQNTTVELLKLCLSRVCDGAKVIIEGDYQTQVDMALFTGARNGMKRAMSVLTGSSLFGHVELQQIWRSELAALVDQM